MENTLEEGRSRRQKRESTSYKAKAFEKFKQLKSGNRNKYDIGEVENVYDTVDEKEYTEKVLARQDDDWIVDDDGSGYVEDGRDVFDDDLDRDSINKASTSTRGKGVKRKKKALAENAGKGKLQYLISNMPKKRREVEKLDEDETLTELLEELNESTSQVNSPRPKPITCSPFLAKRAETEYMRSLTVTLKRSSVNIVKSSPKPSTSFERSSIADEMQIEESVLSDTNGTLSEEVETISHIEPNHFSDAVNKDPETFEPPSESKNDLEDVFNDDFDMSEIEHIETKLNQKPIIENNDESMSEWMTNDLNSSVTCIDLENSDIPLTDVNGEKVFRFFWWDAFEDPYKKPGVVLLFGKTYHETTKSYISCCVTVKNIERKIFFLPRITKQNSDQQVTSEDVYKEISEKVMKDLEVKQFKAKPVTKKYAFDPNLPTESDYIEVRYSAKYPALSSSTKGKTFNAVFGTESSFLEILLIERKIKGPCWLNISNPVPVTNPLTWCKLEVDCNKTSDLKIAQDIRTRPPLIITAINMRVAVNPKTFSKEIVMLSCVTNTDYSVDKQSPEIPFQKHFCVFTCPEHQIPPLDLHTAMCSYKGTKIQKMNSERALLNYFISQFHQLDSDLIVGHDLQGYQMSILSERLAHYKNNNFSKLGRIKRTMPKSKFERHLFVGRLVCDIKISAKELIKCRSYDLESLCQAVLKVQDGRRVELDCEEISKMFQTSADILRLVSLTMQDTAYIIKIMFVLNIIPLALQITNIAGNVMSKTLLGGRSERNEFLLLHAFAEKDYIVPDKIQARRGENKSDNSRKKPTYAGGLVLEPKTGFYDKLILLMDFNSLYPSIIQEYNICFTTMPLDLNEDKMVLPDKSLSPGILPTEIRKLVESRREVKKLMNAPDISNDLRMQYHIRQMALKLTANSMYGCLGFSNSRFYAKNLAALITYKGREILTNTKDLVEKLGHEVIYGDTDSLMINTNITDFEQVFKVGNKIKQEINKMYKQIELDIDGVFKYLLLLKKKKYAATTVNKLKSGELKFENEYKGLDIVRRDWSRIASETGKLILNQILSDQSIDDRINNIMLHLKTVRSDLEAGKIPLSLLVITKQLTKNIESYTDINALPHVQVAKRYNQKFGGHFRAGDTIPYIVCEDGTSNAATQRAYHIEELKNSSTLKIDVKYYLTQQIYPVVSRLCNPMEEIDVFLIAEALGVDTSTLKKAKTLNADVFGENVTKPEVKFRDAKKFVFKCYSCKSENCVDGILRDNVPVLEKCSNSSCSVRPADYVPCIKNQLITTVNSYIQKYYLNELYCEDPLCTNETTSLPMKFSGKYPVCTSCRDTVMLKKYTEYNLYSQISYFKYIFDLSQLSKKPILEYRVERGYHDLRETVGKFIDNCAYSVVDLDKMFRLFNVGSKTKKIDETEELVIWNDEEEIEI